LRALEQAAAAVGAGDLAARAPESGGPEEVRSLARVFNQTVGKVEQLVRVQADFVADASHELRTPLTALRLRLETGDLEGALAEVARLGDRVDGLLALARADVRPASVVDVAATVRERVEHWRPLADEHALHLRADVDGAAPVRAAPERVEQVLDNLLANAVEAVPAGGSVVVSVERAAPWVKLRVRDTGPGMTAEQRTRAFERFFGSGSGLGLAIVRRLVETDGGTVELADAPGGGLEAVVRLRAS
jgi:two-component system, OmpR family, sensor kinase